MDIFLTKYWLREAIQRMPVVKISEDGKMVQCQLQNGVFWFFMGKDAFFTQEEAIENLEKRLHILKKSTAGKIKKLEMLIEIYRKRSSA
jgi:hypothetical protein